MSVKDEDPAQPADQPDVRSLAPGSAQSPDFASGLAPEPRCDEPAAQADSEDGAGTGSRADSAALGELASSLGRVQEQIAEFHRRSAHRESVIDRLHEENQLLRGGLGRTVLEPVVTDLIRLHDQLSREVRRLEASGQDSQLTVSFADDVTQILERCGIEVFSAEPGDPFDRARHRPLGVVACHEESRHNTVAEVVAVGFAERDTGRLRRPVQARFHQYTPSGDEASQGCDAAQSQ